MGKLELLGSASNERRNQNIMLLRKGFNSEKYNTIADAVKYMGYTEKTVLSWAVEGDIPLLDAQGQSVVALNDSNARHVNEKNRSTNIDKMCELFFDAQAKTVIACSDKMGYPETTIINWAILGDVPLLQADGSPVVPLNDTNTPYWFDTL